MISGTVFVKISKFDANHIHSTSLLHFLILINSDLKNDNTALNSRFRGCQRVNISNLIKCMVNARNFFLAHTKWLDLYVQWILIYGMIFLNFATNQFLKFTEKNTLLMRISNLQKQFGIVYWNITVQYVFISKRIKNVLPRCSTFVFTL